MMKNSIITTLLFFSVSISLLGQNQAPPQLTSFSALVLDNVGNPVLNTPVIMRFNFREGSQTGPILYCALHEDTTNSSGYVAMQFNRNILGVQCNGALLADYDEIPWYNANAWLEIEYQTAPTNPFVSLGVMELASVYYAFHVGSADEVNDFPFDDSGAVTGQVVGYNSSTQQWEPINLPNYFSGNYNDLTGLPQNISYFFNDAGYLTNPNDADANSFNELQNWNSLPGKPPAFADGTDDVNDADASSTNELQTWSTLPGKPSGFVDGVDDVDDSDPSAANEIQSWNNLPNVPQVFYDGVDDVNDADASSTNELQDWNTLDGNMPAIFVDGIDDVDDADADPTNELQEFSVSVTGDTLFLSESNYVRVPEISFANFYAHSCGEPYVHNSSVDYGSLIDQDGNQYRTVVIGDQEWMAENLQSSTYSLNGDSIYAGQSTCPVGRSYNWLMVSDPRNVCPVGWHVSTDIEWNELIQFVDPNAAQYPIGLVTDQISPLISSSPVFWNTGQFAGGYLGPTPNNNTGFSIGGLWIEDYYWTASEDTEHMSYATFYLFTLLGQTMRLDRFNYFQSDYYRVRCIKDPIPTGVLNALNCGGSIFTDTIILVNQPVAGAQVSIPYSGANGGSYNAQSVTSTGVTGLILSTNAGNFNNGAGNLTFNITGTALLLGTAQFNLSIGGQNCTVEVDVDNILASIDSLFCNDFVLSDSLVFNSGANNVTLSVPYSGGNGGYYYGDTASSSGVSGLLANLMPDNLVAGSDTLVYVITGTPEGIGTATFELNVGGQQCSVSIPVLTEQAIQIDTEGFEAGGTGTWSSGQFGNTTTNPCESTRSIRYNMYSSFSSTAELLSPVFVSNGLLVTMSFGYKIVEYGTMNATPAANFTGFVQYGSTPTGPWTTVYTIDATTHTPSATCATPSFTFTPPAGNLYVRFDCIWNTGDFYVYLDDIDIYQTTP